MAWVVLSTRVWAQAPAITQEPVDQVVSPGADLSLRFNATASGAGTIQRFRTDGTNETLLVVTNLSRPALNLTLPDVRAIDAGGYSAVVSEYGLG